MHISLALLRRVAAFALLAAHIHFIFDQSPAFGCFPIASTHRLAKAKQAQSYNRRSYPYTRRPTLVTALVPTLSNRRADLPRPCKPTQSIPYAHPGLGLPLGSRLGLAAAIGSGTSIGERIRLELPFLVPCYRFHYGDVSQFKLLFDLREMSSQSLPRCFRYFVVSHPRLEI